MKKTIIITAALMLLISALVTGTFASFSRTISGSVTLTSYDYDASVNGTSDGDLDIAPGQTKSGTFQVTNTGSGKIKVSSIVVTSSDSSKLAITEVPEPTGDPIAKNGMENYTFKAKLGESINESGSYVITIQVTVVDDLGNSDVITTNGIAFN